MKNVLLLVAGAALLALTLPGCARKPSTPPARPSVVSPAPKAAASQVAPAKGPELSGTLVNGVREIELEAFRYGYKPDPIVVKKGEKVRILAKSRDVTHGFGIKDLSINARILPDKETTVEFTPKKAGSFQIHCTVYCGPGHEHMHGTLIVLE
jgi:heme/copper-type cytochrome/quinol oxidase subunit 2